MLRLANAGLHALHLVVIGFTLVGWVLPATRPLHLAVCGLTFFSWFVLGPLLGKTGYCFLTGFQHRVWRSMGRSDADNYMSYLYARVTGHPVSPRSRRLIDWTSQGTLYACTLLTLALR